MHTKKQKRKENLEKMPKVRITLNRSLIGQGFKAKETIKSLGLKKINSSGEREVDDSLQGMLNKVNHLVEVEEIK